MKGHVFTKSPRLPFSKGEVPVPPLKGGVLWVPPFAKRARGILMVLGIVTVSVTACEKGYEDGPFERGARTALNGWDMWDTPSVRPYEAPMPDTPEGSVPTEDRFSYKTSETALKNLDPQKRTAKAALTYRRYCHHCHGPNGDGRIIVGESHEYKPADLRQPRIQQMDDRALFKHIEEGGQLMLPLGATLSPLEMRLAIEYLRTLKNKPSTPYFKPQFTEPIR